MWRLRAVRQTAAVRWEALFRDLAGQVETADRLELESEVADRSRREIGRLLLADRLRAAVGAQIAVVADASGTIRGQVAAVGTDWLLLTPDPSSEVLLPLTAVVSLAGLPAGAVDAENQPGTTTQPTFGAVLRVIARDRAPVAMSMRDGVVSTGTIDRVGADFVDLSEHPPGEPRRSEAVTGVRTVPFAAIAAVRPI